MGAVGLFGAFTETLINSLFDENLTGKYMPWLEMPELDEPSLGSRPRSQSLEFT